MTIDIIAEYIKNWLKIKVEQTKTKGFVIGVSGGVDSATVSTLCAKTGYPVICLNMPINQAQDQLSKSMEHIKWLTEKYPLVKGFTIDLTKTFNSFSESLPLAASEEIALVNSRSRLRMTTLYAFSGSNNCLVAGTGNKVEDYGIGFFTKFGDGGVDISPIGDLNKTEVYSLAKYLKISESILEAKPTDGLWGDNRTDEDQIGASYANLERAMNFCDEQNIETWEEYNNVSKKTGKLSESEGKILYIYLCRHAQNKHKMEMPPICHVKRRDPNL